jgi:peroxiredoxin
LVKDHAMPTTAETIHPLGWPAADFALPGVDGKTHSLAACRGAKATLVMFLCNHCPYVKGQIDRIVADVAELGAHGVKAVAIMPNDVDAYPADSLDNMVVFARAHGFGFPYLIDGDQSVARAYRAQCTPEFYGFDKDLRLAYHGRLDGAGMKPRTSEKRELFESMLAIAQTTRAPGPHHPSIGCSIKWRAAGRCGRNCARAGQRLW